MISCKTVARAGSGPGQGWARAGPPPRRALTNTGLGLRRAGSLRVSTPRKTCSASSSAPALSGCESSTIRRGVPCCEKPVSSGLPPRSMQGSAVVRTRGGAQPRPYAPHPPPGPPRRSTLPAAAILQRADWLRATLPPRAAVTRETPARAPPGGSRAPRGVPGPRGAAARRDRALHRPRTGNGGGLGAAPLPRLLQRRESSTRPLREKPGGRGRTRALRPGASGRAAAALRLPAARRRGEGLPRQGRGFGAVPHRPPFTSRTDHPRLRLRHRTER